MSKAEISKLLDNHNNPISNYNSTEIKWILNGLFQAEGHIGGYFENQNSMTLNPLVFISLNASNETIQLFKIMNNEFNNKLKYNISKLKSGEWHIKIFSKNWDVIINQWIPYFKYSYGDKYIGLKLLLKIYYLYYSKFGKSTKHTNYTYDHVDNIIKRAYLVYALIDNNKRRILLSEKINLWLKDKHILENIINKIDYNYYDSYLTKLKSNLFSQCNRDYKLHILFLHGFYLGDGNFHIRIRSSDNLPWYIPIFRISQKTTIYNQELFNIIKKFLEENYGIKSIIRLLGTGEKIEILIENQASIKALSRLLSKYPNYYFNKTDQIYLMFQASKLFGKIRYWRNGHISLLKLIYNSKSQNIYNKNSILFYINKVNSYFDNNLRNEYYITIYKDKAYKVKLPISSLERYFYFNIDKPKALLEAKHYRDTILDQWLKNNNL